MELTKSDLKKSFYGLVPTDWITCQFQEVLTGFSSGMTPYRAIPEYYKGNIPWITSGELNYNVITDTIEKITQEAVVKTNLKILPKGTFLMAITGLEAAGTRGSCAITGVEATTNQSCMALFPKEGKIETNYLYHFYVMYGNDLAFKFCQGSKQQSYTGRIVKILPINLPPTLKEQKAIATALSDVDNLITSLENLIAKKQAIKQGAMQQLLTPPHKGGKRLSGFSGEWVEKVIGKIGNTYGGLSGKSKKDFEDGKYPYITFLNVMNNVVIDTSIFEYVHIKPGEQQNKARKGDLFFNTSSETPEEVGMCAVLNEDIGELYLNSFCFGFRLKEDSNVYAYFFSYLINSSIGRNLFLSLAQGATRYNLSKSNFNKLIIEVPSKKEQKAIVKILSDMDTEIEQLETKKAKYQQLKQGMLQELLTGNTRLV
ncbi:restriction endonuclease subunit S [Tenacibaculum maritimum]|uniref:restriction endonuclease subunit S n=1 Tax=Tenacibaculum maritimum TaxID=107401 RepID=UPI0012E4DA1B|nr:restriction endonuclease subunit S [Tenacibaculum maritimum]CAA0242834.1 Type I restriction-modification enzyme S subunit, HsdS family [Tenacibaculum maritimum]